MFYIEGLADHKRVRGLHHGRKDSVERSQYECGEEHDANPQCEGPQQRKEVYGLAACQRLPYTVADVEQRSEACDARGYGGHALAERHHIGIELTEDAVHVVHR